MAWQDFIGSYTLQYVPADMIATQRGSHTLGIFFRMDTDPALHVWMGVNDIPAGFDSIDEDGTIYLGGGRLLNVPSIEMLINGQADDVQFGISGIDPKSAQKVLDEMPDVRGKTVRIGITTLDKYHQPMGKIISLWEGTAAYTKDKMPPVPATEARTVTLILAIVTGAWTRSRPALSVWDSAHQKALYPTDLGCDATARLARGVAPEWPKYV
jgi:hypothetical protein